MGRNVKVLLAVSILFGIAGGIYEFVLPYYLEGQGLSFKRMGYLFAVSTAAMFAVRIGLGNVADRWGSKRLYLLSVLACAVACLGTPFTASLALLIVLRTMREVGVLARDTAHPILIFMEGRGRFVDFIGKTRGMEFLFQAVGTFIAGMGIASIGDRGSLWMGAGALGLAVVLLSVGVRAPERTHSPAPTGFRKAVSFDLPRNLRVIMVSSFIFSAGLSTSHCFIMPLFFSTKFGVSPSTVSTVMVLHRLTFVLPMLLIGYLPLHNYKRVFILTVILEGIAMSAGAIIPDFFWASAIWLLHDLVGAGIWGPIQAAIIQDECRDTSRGRDLSKTLAFSALGGAVGPIMAGYLVDFSISAPFFVSGVLMVASAGVLLKLRLGRGAEQEGLAAAS